MLAARPAAGGASRQKCLATTRAPGREVRPERARAPRRSGAVSAYGGSTMTMSNGAAAAPSAQPATRPRPRDDPGAAPAEVRPREVGGDDRDRRRRRARRTSARAAPRDSASMPAAPLPANRSRTRAPRQVRLEDREQRLLDAVAQRPRPGARAPRAGCPRAVPAMTRPASAIGHGAVSPARRPRRAAASPPSSSAAQRGPRRSPSAPRASSSASACARARTASSRCVGVLERRDAQPRQAALGEAEDVALAAQLEVALGELEAVARLGDRACSRACGDLVGRVRDEDAERLDASRGRPGRAAGGAGRARTGRRPR